MFYLGTITGSSGSAYNNQTGPSGLGTFPIPAGAQALYLECSASGVRAEFYVATGITSFTNTARGIQLAGPNAINGPFRLPRLGPGAPPVLVGISHAQSGFVSVRVFSTPTA